MLAYNSLITFFPEKSHEGTSYGPKSCLGKPNFTLLYHQRQISFCKANQDVQHWSGANNNNDIFREYTYNTISSISQIHASAVTFSQDKMFSLYWEGIREEAVIHRNREKRLHASTPHLPYAKGQTWLEIETTWGGWGTLCFHVITMLFRQVWDLVITTALKALLIWKHNNNNKKTNQH